VPNRCRAWCQKSAKRRYRSMRSMVLNARENPCARERLKLSTLPVTGAIRTPVSFFHVGNTGSNPVADAEAYQHGSGSLAECARRALRQKTSSRNVLGPIHWRTYRSSRASCEPNRGGYLVQLIEERLGVLQIRGVETFGKPVVDVGEHRVRLVNATLFRKQSGQAQRSAELAPLRGLAYPSA
jgi:hypothetical protein